MPGTVTVASKWPHGIHLRTFRMEKAWEPIMGGGSREFERAVYEGRVTIKGTGRRMDDPNMAFGFALTHGVDADAWTKWKKDNEQSDLVKNGLIFAMPKSAEAEGEARNRESLRTGVEPADTNALPAEFKNKIQKATVASAGA